MGFKNTEFNHLHVHSEASRFDGLSKIDDLVMNARRMGFSSLALTDHGNVGGLIKFYQACKRKKDKKDNELLGTDGKPLPILKPIFGEEFYCCRNHKEKNTDGRKGNRHLLLLAKNAEGFKNLCSLSQIGWVDGQYIDPRIDFDLLSKYSNGLICSSACLSSVVNSNLLKGRYDAAKQAATILKDIFKEDFFLEMMYHGFEAEGAIIPDIIKLSKELDIGLIATNDVHYLKKEHAMSQEVLMAMSSSKCIKDPKHYHHPYDEFYLKSAEEMSMLFGTCPEALSNTVAIAERVEDFMKKGTMILPNFDIDSSRKSLGEEFYKDIVDGEIGRSIHRLKSDNEKFEASYKFMSELIVKGMKRVKWDKSQPHLERLKTEMEDVRIAWESNQMDFATYFLVVWDYINEAKKKGILTAPGRGSGYASVILRALGITYGVDVVAMGCIWERFLTFDRKFILTDAMLGLGEEAIEVIADSHLDEDREVEDDLGGTDRY